MRVAPRPHLSILFFESVFVAVLATVVLCLFLYLCVSVFWQNCILLEALFKGVYIQIFFNYIFLTGKVYKIEHLAIGLIHFLEIILSLN